MASWSSEAPITARRPWSVALSSAASAALIAGRRVGMPGQPAPRKGQVELSVVSGHLCWRPWVESLDLGAPFGAGDAVAVCRADSHPGSAIDLSRGH